MIRCGGKWNIDKISKEICRSTSVLAFESCLRALSPRANDTERRGFEVKRTLVSAGQADLGVPQITSKHLAGAPLFSLTDWGSQLSRPRIQETPLSTSLLLIICLNKDGGLLTALLSFTALTSSTTKQNCNIISERS